MQTYLYLHNDDVEVIIDVEYDAIHEPEYIAGLPEDCYPEYSDMTITNYTVVAINQMGDEKHTVTDAEIEAEFQARKDIIEAQCWDDFDAKNHMDYPDEE
jgi:hypothetical protein